MSSEDPEEEIRVELLKELTGLHQTAKRVDALSSQLGLTEVDRYVRTIRDYVDLIHHRLIGQKENR